MFRWLGPISAGPISAGVAGVCAAASVGAGRHHSGGPFSVPAAVSFAAAVQAPGCVASTTLHRTRLAREPAFRHSALPALRCRTAERLRLEAARVGAAPGSQSFVDFCGERGGYPRLTR